MKPRWWLVNVALALGVGFAAMLLRERWMEAERLKAEMLAAKRQTPPNATESKKTPATPLRAASYLEVAEKLLFAKDRNPAVVVEATERKPLPALPSAFGVMDLGQGRVVFLAMKGDSQRGYREGESIGDWKIAGLTGTEITLEFEDQRITKRLDEMRGESRETAEARTASPPPSNAPSVPIAAPARGPEPQSSVSSPGSPQKAALGPQAGADTRYCNPGDGTPDGTVVDGYRKTSRRTPFGVTCLWEKAQ